MKKILIPFTVLVLFSACKNDKPGGDSSKETGEHTATGTKVVEEDERNILIDFRENQFADKNETELLQELNLCDINQKDLNNASKPACDAKFFKVLPYSDDHKLEDAFLVVSRAGVHDWPLRRVMVFQREGTALVNVNTFIGNLVGNKKSQSGYDDLYIQFVDEYENRFECIFKWAGGRYKYESVKRINGSKLKSTLQDSMNVEIGKELLRLKVMR